LRATQEDFGSIPDLFTLSLDCVARDAPIVAIFKFQNERLRRRRSFCEGTHEIDRDGLSVDRNDRFKLSLSEFASFVEQRLQGTRPFVLRVFCLKSRRDTIPTVGEAAVIYQFQPINGQLL
jgi:hypothetical protein